MHNQAVHIQSFIQENRASNTKSIPKKRKSNDSAWVKQHPELSYLNLRAVLCMMLTKNDNGFTGIEAAIILIALVVVAAVFSSMMLGAGFFTTQKSQEVVHSGIMEVNSRLAPSGNVIVRSTANGYAGDIIFYVTNTAGGSPVDLNKIIISYTDNDDFVSQEYSTGTNRWTYTPIIYDPGHNDNLLESSEKSKIDLNLTTFGVKTLPGVDEQVKIEVKPPEGAVLVIQLTMPLELDNNSYYQVY